MDTDEISRAALRAMTLSVLGRVEHALKALRPDTSAIAPEEVVGFEAGFRACKRAMFDALAE
jgi:hypothetical protein